MSKKVPDPPRALVGAVRRTRVRCLGPAKSEHTFLSASPSERVCPRCRRLQTAMHLSPLRIVPLAVQSE